MLPIVWILIVIVLAWVTKKIFTSPKVDKLAKTLCTLEPEKEDAKELFQEGSQIIDRLDTKAKGNKESQKQLKEENDAIKSFSRELSDKAQELSAEPSDTKDSE